MKRIHLDIVPPPLPASTVEIYLQEVYSSEQEVDSSDLSPVAGILYANQLSQHERNQYLLTIFTIARCETSHPG